MHVLLLAGATAMQVHFALHRLKLAILKPSF